MPKHQTADVFLKQRFEHFIRCRKARVAIMRIMGRSAPSAFMIDPRTGRTFLPPTTETRHYPHGAGSPT